MASLLAVQKLQLYVSMHILSDQAHVRVSTKVNDVDSLISSMNDLITTENKCILVKRTLTLSIYGESSYAGPLYLNHLINLDFFDRISAKDQAGLLMEESSVGAKDSSGNDRKSFVRLTGHLRDQGAVGMITDLQSGMTLFLKPSGQCRAQMYSLSSQVFRTWSLVTARRIAVESEAARIAAEVEATRIAAKIEADRIAVEVEAARISAEIARIARRDAVISVQIEAARLSAAESTSAHRPVEQSPECKQAERERYEFVMRMIINMTSGTSRGRQPISLRLLKPYPQEPPSY